RRARRRPGRGLRRLVPRPGQRRGARLPRRPPRGGAGPGPRRPRAGRARQRAGGAAPRRGPARAAGGRRAHGAVGGGAHPPAAGPARRRAGRPGRRRGRRAFAARGARAPPGPRRALPAPAPGAAPARGAIGARARAGAHRCTHRPHATGAGRARPRGGGRPDPRPAPRLGLPRPVTAQGEPRLLAGETWRDVADAPPHVLAVPLGSTEQHGPHLPLGTDTLVATALAHRLAAARGDVVVAPALAYGSSGEHAGFPGPPSIGQAALEPVAVELVRSPDALAGTG